MLAPTLFIVSSRIDWAPYLEYAIDCVKNGKAIDTDWTGTLSTGSVVLTDVTLRQLPKAHRLRLMKLRQSLKAVSFMI